MNCLLVVSVLMAAYFSHVTLETITCHSYLEDHHVMGPDFQGDLVLVCCSIYSRYIEERSFRRFVEACLEETVVVYVDHLLTQVGIVSFLC